MLHFTLLIRLEIIRYWYFKEGMNPRIKTINNYITQIQSFDLLFVLVNT